MQERLGSPEGELAVAQAIAYLAVAAKSNAVYNAYNRARDLVARNPSNEVPLHLRNAPTKLMKSEGYGAEYHYAHDFPEAFVAGENYFPWSCAIPGSTNRWTGAWKSASAKSCAACASKTTPPTGTATTTEAIQDTG